MVTNEKNKAVLQQISDTAWLLRQGPRKVGILNKDIQEKFFYINGKTVQYFENEEEVINEEEEVVNEDEALKYAMTYGRDLTLEEARKFVRMYVNKDTLDMGEEGHKAIISLFNFAKEKGIISAVPEIDLIFPH